jgi:hypothetical protein
MRSRHVVGAVAALALVLVGAMLPAAGQTVMGADEAAKYNAQPLSVPVPPSLTEAEIESAMVSTLEGRKWTVTERSPQQVVGKLVHRGFDAKVILKVEGPLVKILNDSRYKSPQTGQLEPAIPKGWLKNIERDLQVSLSKKAGQK